MAELKLRNFAKIKESSLDIKDITVIAGKPGTGKSYIMKFLYGIEEAFFKINNNDKAVKLLEIIGSNTFSKDVDKVKKIRENNSVKLKDAEDLEFTINRLTDFLKTIEDIELIKNNKESVFFKKILNSIFINLDQISTEFDVLLEDYISLRYIDNGLKVKIKNKNYAPSNNIFVETPLILEFKRFMNRNKDKSPYHIESLLNVLDKNFSSPTDREKEFIENFEKRTIGIIEGNIEDKNDSFILKKFNNNEFDIINASSGIKSIGLLQYLVSNNALKRASVLFWEEPEVHLHPTWQLKMIELFIELMNAGVKIVFSTHSPYMCDYLNALSEKGKFRNKISFNLLNEENSIVENTVLDDDNWNKLQSELLDPLEEIMWEYL